MDATGATKKEEKKKTRVICNCVSKCIQQIPPGVSQQQLLMQLVHTTDATGSTDERSNDAADSCGKCHTAPLPPLADGTSVYACHMPPSVRRGS